MNIVLFSSMFSLPEHCNIIIFGAGGRGYQILSLINKFRKDITVTGFADTYKQGDFKGHKILNPTQTRDILTNCSQTKLIIASRSADQIYCSLMKLGIKEAYIPNPLFVNIQKNPDATTENLKELQSELSEIRSMFKREKDREFIDIIPKLFTLEPDYEEAILTLFKFSLPLCEQYFDFINKAKIRVAIDGGMESGSTTFRFLHHFPGVEVYAFEPFPAAVQLSPYYPYLLKNKNVIINYCGLSNESSSGWLGINPTCFAGNQMIDLTTPEYISKVTTVSIDDFVKIHPGIKIDFIKLDIEAFESKAICGAKNTIINHRPQLAICIYHTMSDYYKIPKLLSNICTDYNFYLGTYDPQTLLETVLYCIPQEIDINQ